MMKVKGIFAVSLIAMMVVGGAYANIASQGYVDQQVDAKQNASTAVKVATAGTAVGDATHPVYVNASGVATRIDKVAAAASADTATSATKATQDASGNVITTTYATKTELNAKADAEDIPTVNNATLTIQKNGATVGTFTANASANKTINITVPTTTSQLTNNSGFITADDLPKDYTLPVATSSALGGVKSGGNITVATSGAVTVNSATKATQDASGNVITTTYATKSELTNGLSGKQATLSGAQLKAVNSGITSAKVSTYDGYNAKITAAQTAAQTAADAADAAQTAAETAQSTATAAQNAANAKVATAQGSGNANKAVITNSSGNITTGTISSGMIADDAVTAAKIATGAVGTDGLASGAVTSAKIADSTIVNADISASAAIAASKISGLATVATSGSYDDLTDKPTIPAAITVDSALSSTSTNPVQNKVINAALIAKQNSLGYTAENQANKTSALRSADLADDTRYPTEKAVRDAIDSRVYKQWGTSDGHKLVVTDENATVTVSKLTGDYIGTGVIEGVHIKDGSIPGSDIQEKSIYANRLADSTVSEGKLDTNVAEKLNWSLTNSGSGAVVTGVSKSGNTVTVTKGNVQIPVGSATATSYATIWVQ